MTTRVGLVGVLAAALLLPARAFAYRTIADKPELSGTHIGWETSTIEIVADNNYPVGVAREALESALQDAMNAWNGTPCTVPKLRFTGWVQAAAEPDDESNTVTWVLENWSERGFEPDAVGFTDLKVKRDKTGSWSIVEADVYVNAQLVAWAAEAANQDQRSPRAVLTHELGHLLGLAHPCEVLPDDQVPSCSETPGAREALMYPLYDAERLVRSADDEAGLCSLYPQRNPPGDAGPASREGAEGEGSEVTPEPERDPGAGSTHPGDPCTRNRDCISQVCNTEGFCSLAEDEPGSTSSGDSGFGQSCYDATDCLGRECLTGTSMGSVCTRPCEQALECPEHWLCEAVEDRSVCVPEPSSSSCSYSVAGRPRPELATLVLFITLVLRVRRLQDTCLLR